MSELNVLLARDREETTYFLCECISQTNTAFRVDRNVCSFLQLKLSVYVCNALCYDSKAVLDLGCVFVCPIRIYEPSMQTTIFLLEKRVYHSFKKYQWN